MQSLPPWRSVAVLYQRLARSRPLVEHKQFLVNGVNERAREIVQPLRSSATAVLEPIVGNKPEAVLVLTLRLMVESFQARCVLKMKTS